jgi:hypothetical protein
MTVQEDVAKAARAAVEPLYREIDRLTGVIMRKRERGENTERELEAIEDNRRDIVRIQKPFIEYIASLPPAPIILSESQLGVFSDNVVDGKDSA